MHQDDQLAKAEELIATIYKALRIGRDMGLTPQAVRTCVTVAIEEGKWAEDRQGIERCIKKTSNHLSLC